MARTSLVLGRVGFLGAGWVGLMVALGLSVARPRTRVLALVVKGLLRLLHDKFGVRCLWQRF